ncbi:MAG: hypothetical protein V3U29_08230 [Phycisphaeraceae bacterium]
MMPNDEPYAAAPPLPGADHDLQDPKVVIDLFRQAARANLKASGRQGATVVLPNTGRLIMSGDLHDNGLNLQRLLKLADLTNHQDRHLILHEIVHGPHRINGRDLSIRTLARVAALKLDYPDRVHLLQANHELSQLGGGGILKGSSNVVESFDDGVDFIYADDADEVRNAMKQFIKSLLLAVRCPKGIFCCHSLPSPRQLNTFDTTVIDRVPTDQDLSPGGSAYNMVWGRNHTQDLADVLAEVWQTQLFVMGHQPAEMGYETEGDTILILNSDHSHGMALPIDLSRIYSRDQLVDQLVPLASVMV